MIWQPIDTAPRDGTVFIARVADHPEWGSFAMLRHIVRFADPDTGRIVVRDLGAWIHITDDSEYHWQEYAAPSAPIAVASDRYNKSVIYEWTPFP